MMTFHTARRAAPTLSRSTRLCAALASVLISMTLLGSVVIGFGSRLSSDAGAITARAPAAHRG